MDADFRSDPHELLAHAARVRALARALVGDGSVAQDVEQAAWARALSARSFVPRDTAAWLATIVRNVVRSKWRADARRVAREAQASPSIRAVSTPDEILEREELRRKLVERVLALDDPWRSALVLHYFEERDLRQVAQATGVPLETARTRVKRGLELLRAQLKRESGGAWAVAFVRLFDLERDALVAPTTLGGIVAMGAALKLGIGAVAGVVVLATLLNLRGGAPASPAAIEAAAATHSAAPTLDRGAPNAVSPVREEARVATPGTESPSASNAPAQPSVRVRVRWASDRTPAMAVWVQLQSMSDRVPQLQLRRQRTDANGEVLFEQVAPGRIVAETDRGAEAVDSVALGEHKLVEIELPSGFRLLGETVDEHGRPVAGAEIWIDSTGPAGRGFPVAVSDAAGRFEVRDLDRSSFYFIGARAGGRAPTRQQLLRAAAPEEVRVRIEFEAPGDSLVVVVRDSDGAPVHDATVYVGEHDWREPGSLAGATHLAPAPPLSMRTDKVGEARFEGVKLGSTALIVRSPDFAPWKDEIEIGARRSIAVTLQRGVSLRGKVVDVDGKPVNNARISVGVLGEVSEAYTVAGRDGGFVLPGLPVGEFTAIAQAQQLGRAEQVFVAAAGEELEWNPRIARLGAIVGRLVAPGMSTSGWMVEWSAGDARGPDAVLHARVGEDGRFRLSGCEDVPGELRVLQALNSPFVVARVPNVRPSASEVVVEVDASRRPSIRLRGRVVDERGEPLTDVEVSPFAFELGASPVEHVDPRTGAFELGPYPASQWGLVLVARDRPTLRIPPQRVGVDETHDFGDLVMSAGGVLAVTILREPNVLADEVEVSLMPLDDQLTDGFRGKGSLVRSHPLATGRYELQVFASDGLSESVTVEALAGAETAVEVRLRPGARWNARVVDAEGRPWNGFVSWMATQGSHTVASGFESVVDGALTPSFSLPAGDVDVLVVSQDGTKSAQRTLPAELDARAALLPLQFELR